MSLTHRTAMTDLAAGLYAALNTTQMTALAPVFRVYVPQGQVCPYAVLQNFAENPGWETMGQPSKDCTFQLHIVSESRGEVEANSILDAGIGILCRGFFGSTATPLTVANHKLLLMQYEGSDGYEDDETGVLRYHRIGRFRAQLDQSA